MAVLAVTGGLIIATILMVWWLWENNSFRRTLKKIPSPPRLPLVGNVHLLKPGPDAFYIQLLDWCEKYGGSNGVSCMWIGTTPILNLSRASSVEPFLSGSHHLTKSYEYRYLMPWLNTGLLTSMGNKWKGRRRLLTPSFHFKILEEYQKVFNEHARVLINQLERKVGQTEPFDVCPFYTLCTLDVICETAMGTHTSAQTDGDSEYVQSVKMMSQVIQMRFVSPWMQSDILFNNSFFGKTQKKCLQVLHGFTRKVIEERSAELDDQLANQTGKVSLEDLQTDKPFLIGKQKRLAFLDMLLIAAKGGADLSFDDIQEEVDTFMFEGHDTTSNAATWATYVLGRYPEVQWKAQQEVDKLFGDSDRDLSMEDLKDLSYLECVLKESMRVLPTVPGVGRLVEEDCVVGGYDVPKGTSVNILISSVHKDPEIFPNPDKFDPDRWLPENKRNRHPYSHIPFSAGSRNCIGQRFALNELKTILSRILRNFTITSHQSMDEVRPSTELVLRPQDGIRITLAKRTAGQTAA